MAIDSSSSSSKNSDPGRHFKIPSGKWFLNFKSFLGIGIFTGKSASTATTADGAEGATATETEAPTLKGDLFSSSALLPTDFLFLSPGSEIFICLSTTISEAFVYTFLPFPFFDILSKQNIFWQIPVLCPSPVYNTQE